MVIGKARKINNFWSSYSKNTCVHYNNHLLLLSLARVIVIIIGHCMSLSFSLDMASAIVTMELKQGRRRRQRERQKSNGFKLAKQQLCTCITFFSTFLSRRCSTTT